MELAEEVGCGVVIACVNKNDSNANDIVRSYARLGFYLVDPSRNQCVSLAGYIMLAKDVNC